jgi:hypothetical protein
MRIRPTSGSAHPRLARLRGVSSAPGKQLPMGEAISLGNHTGDRLGRNRQRLRHVGRSIWSRRRHLTATALRRRAGPVVCRPLAAVACRQGGSKSAGVTTIVAVSKVRGGSVR